MQYPWRIESTLMDGKTHLVYSAASLGTHEFILYYMHYKLQNEVTLPLREDECSTYNLKYTILC